MILGPGKGIAIFKTFGLTGAIFVQDAEIILFLKLTTRAVEVTTKILILSLTIWIDRTDFSRPDVGCNLYVMDAERKIVRIQSPRI